MNGSNALAGLLALLMMAVGAVVFIVFPIRTGLRAMRYGYQVWGVSTLVGVFPFLGLGPFLALATLYTMSRTMTPLPENGDGPFGKVAEDEYSRVRRAILRYDKHYEPSALLMPRDPLKRMQERQRLENARKAELQGLQQTIHANALVLALKDENSHVRTQAAFVLGKLADPRTVEALTEAENDPDEAVRTAAAKALEEVNYHP